MTGMELLPRLALNEIGHPPGGPQPGAITQGLRTLLETAAQLFQVRRFKAWPTACASRLLERPCSVGFPSPMPAADRLPVHVELPGHLGLAQALVEEFGGFESPPLQFVKIAFNAFGITHAQRVARESTAVTILCEIQ